MGHHAEIKKDIRYSKENKYLPPGEELQAPSLPEDSLATAMGLLGVSQSHNCHNQGNGKRPMI